MACPKIGHSFPLSGHWDRVLPQKADGETRNVDGEARTVGGEARRVHGEAPIVRGETRRVAGEAPTVDGETRRVPFCDAPERGDDSPARVGESPA